MLQWVANGFGSPEQVLVQREHDLPVAGPQQAVVRVLTASLALPDVMMVEGTYPMTPTAPVVPGQEVVGIVETASEGFPYPTGTKVVGGAHFDQGFGGLAEYTLMPSWSAFEVLEGLTDEQAVGFVGSFHLAHIGLFHRAALSAGETVLVLGGAGRTGSAAIQVAKAMGAKVVATARSEAAANFCREQGADIVIAGADELPTGISVDVVYDTVGSDVYRGFAPSFAPGARLLLIGYASGQPANLDAYDILMRGYSVSGVLSSFRSQEEQEVTLRALREMVATQAVAPPVSTVFDFNEVPSAMKERSEHTLGQMVIRVSDS